MPNAYRSIGGRANTSGVERIDRDGQMEKLQMGEAEVTPRERINWYNKAGLDPRGSLPEEIYEVAKNENDNMNVTNEERTRLPRPHQYSTEARMAEARGEKLQHNMSVGNDDRAFGVTPGMVLTKGDTRNVVVKEKIATEKKEQKVLTDSDEKQTFDGNNSNYPPRDIEVRKAYAKAFVKVANIMDKGSCLHRESLLSISESSGLPIEEVFLLEKVARSNPDLVQKYKTASIKTKAECDCSCGADVPPGVKPKSNEKQDEVGVVKVSKEPVNEEEEKKKKFMEHSYDAGLIDVKPV